MRTYIILFTFCFMSLTGFSQKLQLEKASPFTAVKWKNNKPVVKFNSKWYTLKKLDVYTTKELLEFCKQEFGAKWQKRFSEDLVEVLTKMGAIPEEKVKLLLSSGKQQKNVIGTYTLENRIKVLEYNYKTKKRLKKITIAQAIEDINEFEHSLKKRSSYLRLTDYNYKSAIQLLKSKIETSKSTIDINYLTHELAKILSEIGDRHSSVKNELFEKQDCSTYTLQLPFLIAPLNEKVATLKRINEEGVYKYLDTAYPYLKSINGMDINEMIDALVYKSKKAPKAAKFNRGVSEIQQLGRLYFKNNLKLPKQIEVVFTNGKTDKKEYVQLQDESFRYYSKLERNVHLKSREIKKGNLNSISKLLTGNIGYIALPQMYHFNRIDGLENYIDSTFSAFKNTKALIIDVRFNLGGVRDLTQKIASYIVPKSNAPWIANVAYLRTDEKNTIHNSMTHRFLYKKASNTFDDLDRKTIEVFSNSFKTEKEFETSKFSNPHYMVLKSGNKNYTKPVYILVNERSFSAATVFTSAFKGLPNIKIVGVTTDGSSGNSKKVYLKNSNIRVKISTMLSFQRNGETLDGNGTKPDIYISENKEQVLKGDDVQLKRVIEIINSQ